MSTNIEQNEEWGTQIHASAYVDIDAYLSSNPIGKGTKVWHYSRVMPSAIIGKNCTIGQGCFIAGIIGDRCKIQNNAQIFDGVIIKDDVFIGPSTIFSNVRNPRSFIEQKDNFEQTIIEEGVTIGAGAIIRCGITIGEYAFVGCGSVITKNVKPYSMVYGNPAQQFGWVCKNGHRKTRRAETCKVCGDENG